MFDKYGLVWFSLLCPVSQQNHLQAMLWWCVSEAELEVQRTCLHPIQELFLWTLHAKRLELAIVFWERCDVSIFFSFPSACSCFHGVSDETGGKPISLLKVSSCVVLGSAWLRCGRKLVSVVWRGVLCPQGISCMLQCLASWFFFVKC